MEMFNVQERSPLKSQCLQFSPSDLTWTFIWELYAQGRSHLISWYIFFVFAFHSYHIGHGPEYENLMFREKVPWFHDICISVLSHWTWTRIWELNVQEKVPWFHDICISFLSHWTWTRIWELNVQEKVPWFHDICISFLSHWTWTRIWELNVQGKVPWFYITIIYISVLSHWTWTRIWQFNVQGKNTLILQ